MLHEAMRACMRAWVHLCQALQGRRSHNVEYPNGAPNDAWYVYVYGLTGMCMWDAEFLSSIKSSS